MHPARKPQLGLDFDALDLHRISADQLRETLLPKTIENAQKTPFFAEHWRSVATRVRSLSQLSELPLIWKEQIRAAANRARNREGLRCDESITSGSDGAPPLVIARSKREQLFIQQFFEPLAVARPMRLRGLKFSDPFHGYHITVPSPVHLHRVSVLDSGAFQYARSVLASEHYDAHVTPRCSILFGGMRDLEAFTVDTATESTAPRSYLKEIVSVGEYLPDVVRLLLQRTWNARVVDRFSVSEVFGGATSWRSWWHFDAFVLPEVISFHTRKPIREGTGLLVLTALYPFQQAQPLVRYVTGDLVEVTHKRSARPGTLAFRPLGRTRHSVPAPTNGWLLTHSSVLEALEGIEDVRREPTLLAHTRPQPELGPPSFSISWHRQRNTTCISIVVHVRDTAPARTVGIRRRLLNKLLTLNPQLRATIDAGTTLDITFKSRRQLETADRRSESADRSLLGLL